MINMDAPRQSSRFNWADSGLAATPLIRAALVFVGLVACLRVSFTINPIMLFPNPDPLFFYVSYSASRAFGSMLDLQSFTFGQGFGAFQHPTLLHPFWWIFNSTQSVVLTYFATIVALLLGTLAYHRAVGGSIFSAMLSGMVACALFFNPKYLIDYFGATGAHHLAQIGFTYLGLALLFGPGSLSLLWSATGMAVVIWAVLADWLYASFLIPFVLINLFVWGVYADRRRRPWLAATGIVGFGLLYALGVYDAYDGFTVMSARLWGFSSWDEMPTSLLIFGGVQGVPFAPTFRILATAGVLYHLVVWRPRLSLLAALIALYVGVLAVFDLNAAGSHTYWTLPTINYFERPLFPFYGIMVISAASEILALGLGVLYARVGKSFPDWLGVRRRPGVAPVRESTSATAIAICLAVPTAVMFMIGVPGSSRWNSAVQWLPARWDITQAFVKELGLPQAQGHDFSPYFYDATSEQKVDNCRHLISLPFEAFNRYCGHMMNLLSTKQFIEFHNLVDLQTNQMYAQAYAFAHRSDVSNDPNPDGSLRSFGIRYVAVDGDVDGGKHLSLGGQNVTLVDLGPVSASDLSVKTVKYDPVYDVEEVAAARRAGNAIIHDRVAADTMSVLAPIESMKFEYRSSRFLVSAESSGNSLLLLPFQFSNCLSISGGDGTVDLVRIDGAQAALHFQKRVDVQIRNNLRFFGDTKCRTRDFVDVVKIGLWPRRSYEQLTGDRRVPLLMRLTLQARIRQRDAIPAADGGH